MKKLSWAAAAGLTLTLCAGGRAQATTCTSPKVAFEVVGAEVQPAPVLATVVLDCRAAPGRGCSTGLGLLPALALLLLVRRRP